MYYVYLLRSLKTGQVYTGFTKDLKRRLSEHKAGKTRTTNKMLPLDLIFYEAFKDERDAVRREEYLKTTKGKSTVKMMLQYSIKTE